MREDPLMWRVPRATGEGDCSLPWEDEVGEKIRGIGRVGCNTTHRCRNLSSPTRYWVFTDPYKLLVEGLFPLSSPSLQCWGSSLPIPPLLELISSWHPYTLRPHTWGRTRRGFLTGLGSSKTSWTKPTKNPNEGLAFVCITIADVPPLSYMLVPRCVGYFAAKVSNHILTCQGSKLESVCTVRMPRWKWETKHNSYDHILRCVIRPYSISRGGQ